MATNAEILDAIRSSDVCALSYSDINSRNSE